MLSAEGYAKEIAEWSQRLSTEEIEEQKTCSEVYTKRFLVYAEHMENVLHSLTNNSQILLCRVIKHEGTEAFHLMAKGQLYNRTFYLRFVETQPKGMCKLHYDTRLEEEKKISRWEWNTEEHALEPWNDIGTHIKNFMF